MARDLFSILHESVRKWLNRKHIFVVTMSASQHYVIICIVIYGRLWNKIEQISEQPVLNT